MAEVSVSAVRTQFRSLLERVGRGEEITITRYGRPVAVLIKPSRLRARRAAFEAADRLGESLEKARRERPPIKPVIPAHRVEEMLKDIQAGREGR